MDALEAKTCENRRFWGRVSEELNSVETESARAICFHLHEVSEELNSVETTSL